MEDNTTLASWALGEEEMRWGTMALSRVPGASFMLNNNNNVENLCTAESYLFKARIQSLFSPFLMKNNDNKVLIPISVSANKSEAESRCE